MLKKKLLEFRTKKGPAKLPRGLAFVINAWEDCERDDLNYLIGQTVQINYQPYKCIGLDRHHNLIYKKGMVFGIICEEKK